MVLFYYNHCKYFISDKTESKTEHYIGKFLVVDSENPIAPHDVCMHKINRLCCVLCLLCSHTHLLVCMCVCVSMFLLLFNFLWNHYWICRVLSPCGTHKHNISHHCKVNIVFFPSLHSSDQPVGPQSIFYLFQKFLFFCASNLFLHSLAVRLDTAKNKTGNRPKDPLLNQRIHHSIYKGHFNCKLKCIIEMIVLVGQSKVLCVKHNFPFRHNQTQSNTKFAHG